MKTLADHRFPRAVAVLLLLLATPALVAQEITGLVVGHANRCLIQPRRSPGKAPGRATPLPSRRVAREIALTST